MRTFVTSDSDYLLLNTRVGVSGLCAALKYLRYDKGNGNDPVPKILLTSYSVCVCNVLKPYKSRSLTPLLKNTPQHNPRRFLPLVVPASPMYVFSP